MVNFTHTYVGACYNKEWWNTTKNNKSNKKYSINHNIAPKIHDTCCKIRLEKKKKRTQYIYIAKVNYNEKFSVQVKGKQSKGFKYSKFILFNFLNFQIEINFAKKFLVKENYH